MAAGTSCRRILCVLVQMGCQISPFSAYRPDINYLFFFIDRIKNYIIAERELPNPLSTPFLNMTERIFIGELS